MSEPKTKKTNKSVKKFLDAVEHDTRREDAKALCALMEKVTGEKPAMWGDSIVGFGSYHYRYASGQEGDWPLTGFSPRKANLSVYVMPGFTRYQDLMAKLGKHKTGRSCLYINKLADVDMKVLERLIREGFKWMKKQDHVHKD